MSSASVSGSAGAAGAPMASVAGAPMASVAGSPAAGAAGSLDASLKQVKMFADNMKLQASLDEASKEIAFLQSQQVKVFDDNAQLQSSLVEASKEIASLRQDLDIVKASAVKNHDKAVAFEAKLEQSEAKLEQSKSELQKAKSELQKALDHIESMNKNFESYSDFMDTQSKHLKTMFDAQNKSTMIVTSMTRANMAWTGSSAGRSVGSVMERAFSDSDMSVSVDAADVASETSSVESCASSASSITAVGSDVDVEPESALNGSAAAAVAFFERIEHDIFFSSPTGGSMRRSDAGRSSGRSSGRGSGRSSGWRLLVGKPSFGLQVSGLPSLSAIHCESPKSVKAFGAGPMVPKPMSLKRFRAASLDA